MSLLRYEDQGQSFEAYLALPGTKTARPGVLLAPTWLNVDEGLTRRADNVAKLGYVCVVADLFGAGVRPRPPQDPMEIVAPLLRDRVLFRRRLSTALNVLQQLPECDANSIAAVGYCLGGAGVLELARAGFDLRGVVALHGILTTPFPARELEVKAKVLVLHGDSDPIVPVEDVLRFREEMNNSRANWQLTVFGEARHSFTGEGVAGKSTSAAALHRQSETRAWAEVVHFLAEVLG